VDISDSTAIAGTVPSKPRRFLLPVGWEVLLSFLVSLGAALVNDKLCLAVVASATCWLVWRHRGTPSSALGIVFSTNCEAPLLRRVHDLHHGFTPGSPILVASYIAFPVLALIVSRDLPRLRKAEFVPVILAAIGLLWAYGVGLFGMGLVPATIQMLQYSAGPIALAYVVANSGKFDLKMFCRWLAVLGLIEGLYGLYQWVQPPPWDLVWFHGVKEELAGGQPLPFQMRTWGTLNIVSPYSYFLAFILTVVLETPKFFLVTPILVAALATTQARSAWGTVLIGWFLALFLSRLRDKGKIFGPIAVTVVIVAVLAIPFANRLDGLYKRLQTVQNIQGDDSFQGRSELFSAALEGGVFNNPFGVGMGASGSAARLTGSGMSGIDNGFLQTAYIFGWVGTFFFLGGFFWGLGRGITGILRMSSQEVLFLAALLALFSANLFESSFDDMKGVLLWVSIGIISTSALRRRTAVAVEDEPVAQPPSPEPPVPELEFNP
jgi:hypothetical protein